MIIIPLSQAPWRIPQLLFQLQALQTSGRCFKQEKKRQRHQEDSSSFNPTQFSWFNWTNHSLTHKLMRHIPINNLKLNFSFSKPLGITQLLGLCLHMEKGLGMSWGGLGCWTRIVPCRHRDESNSSGCAVKSQPSADLPSLEMWLHSFPLNLEKQKWGFSTLP